MTQVAEHAGQCTCTCNFTSSFCLFRNSSTCTCIPGNSSGKTHCKTVHAAPRLLISNYGCTYTYSSTLPNWNKPLLSQDPVQGQELSTTFPNTIVEAFTMFCALWFTHVTTTWGIHNATAHFPGKTFQIYGALYQRNLRVLTFGR